MKKALILTGGGDCPGLNAVIRAVFKRSRREQDWELYGSMEAFNGVLHEPQQVIKLTSERVAGIHVKGGTILKTTNKGNPLNFPVEQPDGTIVFEDRTHVLVGKLRALEFDAIINIGGDGSQRISKALFDRGIPIIGVPKTIDNDLSATDVTFGFQTAVQVATDSFDKLVTTAESHHRVMIMEVMGRDAGWIALHTAIAGGAEVCLIPEIPYDISIIQEKINSRYKKGKGFINIVVAEGACPIGGAAVGTAERESEHKRLRGIAYKLSDDLKAGGCKAEVRETILGHVQRGGTPTAYDRVLATLFGVKAFELALEGKFGQMVTFRNNEISSVSLEEATREYNYVDKDSFLVKAARGLGICLGDRP